MKLNLYRASEDGSDFVFRFEIVAETASCDDVQHIGSATAGEECRVGLKDDDDCGRKSYDAGYHLGLSIANAVRTIARALGVEEGMLKGLSMALDNAYEESVDETKNILFAMAFRAWPRCLARYQEKGWCNVALKGGVRNPQVDKLKAVLNRLEAALSVDALDGLDDLEASVQAASDAVVSESA